MRAILFQIKDEFFDFFKKHKPLVILTVLTLVLCYGFTLTNYAIGLDETDFYGLFDQGHLLAQGRDSAFFIQKLTGIYEFAPFWMDAVALICLFISIILWCVLFKKASGDRLHSMTYTAFATIFVSYPLINEIFIYMTMTLSICLSYLLTVVALLFMLQYPSSRKISLIIASAAVICVAVSFYESFASVYLCGIFCILILENLFGDLKKDFKNILKDLVVFFLPLVIGVIFEFGASNFMLHLSGVIQPHGSETTIYWLTNSITGTVRLLIASIVENFFVAGASYLPIFIFSVSTALCVVLSIVLWVKKRSCQPFILLAGLYLATLSLSLVQGRAAPYRTCQTFAVFVAFLFLLTLQLLSSQKILKALALCSVFIIVLNQSKDLSQWFYMDYLRFQQDKNIVNSVGGDLKQGFDLSKPVVFVGGPKISDYISDYRSIKDHTLIKETAISLAKLLPSSYGSKIMTIIDSRINQTNSHWLFVAWGVGTSGDNAQLIKFMAINGYDLKQCTTAQYKEGCELGKAMPAWPKTGSIKDTGGYILVNFGADKTD